MPRRSLAAFAVTRTPRTLTARLLPALHLAVLNTQSAFHRTNSAPKTSRASRAGRVRANLIVCSWVLPAARVLACSRTADPLVKPLLEVFRLRHPQHPMLSQAALARMVVPKARTKASSAKPRSLTRPSRVLLHLEVLLPTLLEQIRGRKLFSSRFLHWMHVLLRQA